MGEPYSLPTLIESLNQDIDHKLKTVREAMAHPVSKGDGSENTWLEMLKTYLPRRYQADRAFVIDSKNQCSEQIDVVVYDRQYTPLIFHYAGQIIIPAESVYAVFEVKQELNKGYITDAQDKVASVRRLHRTSLPPPHAGGQVDKAKPPPRILGGILALESDWTPPLGPSLQEALRGSEERRLDLGCAARHGYFEYIEAKRGYWIKEGPMPTTSFLFSFITRLQGMGTAPMIDLTRYTKWIAEKETITPTPD